MKKILIVLVILVVIILIAQADSPESATTGDFVIGAALPMTGPAALWGETVKNGMELALKNKTGIKVLYEDTKGVPADGVSAFNRLQGQGVHLTLSEISAVSVPLSKIALEKKVPLFVTLVAASSSIIVNDYTIRYYTDPAHYAGPSFDSPMSPVKQARTIAVLYRNDELGVSVKEEINKLSAQHGKQVVFVDSFKPSETDFSTHLSKIKASGADVLLIVPATPGEAVGIVKTYARLGLTMPVVEASAVFADLGNREQVKGIPFYSTSYDFSLDNEDSKQFREEYKSAFGKEPNFGAAFGYDVLNFIYRCKDQGEGQARDIRSCLKNIPTNQGLAGTVTQVLPGDFVATMHLEKVNQ